MTRQRSSIRKLVIVFAAISFLFLGWRALGFKPTTKTLDGWCSDHFSHWGSALLFTHVGLDSYRLPSGVTCPVNDSPEIREETRRTPEVGLCLAKNAPRGSRPVCINWPQYPQPYPPGLLLFSAPAAALYATGVLTFIQTNTFTVLQYLFFSLVCWVFFTLIVIDSRVANPSETRIQNVLAFAFAVLFYFELCRWALNGIYDGIAVLMVGLAIYSLSLKKHWNVVLFYSLGVFLHFRALWFLPVLGLGLYGGVQRGDFRKNISAILFSALMLGLSAYAFLLLYPAMRGYPVNNPGYWKTIVTSGAHVPIGIAWIIIAGYFVREKAWMVLTVYGWSILFLCSTPETRPWHALFMLPLFFLPLLERKAIRTKLTAALWVYYWVNSSWVFRQGGYNPWHWEFLKRL